MSELTPANDNEPAAEGETEAVPQMAAEAGVDRGPPTATVTRTEAGTPHEEANDNAQPAKSQAQSDTALGQTGSPSDVAKGLVAETAETEQDTEHSSPTKSVQRAESVKAGAESDPPPTTKDVVRGKDGAIPTELADLETSAGRDGRTDYAKAFGDDLKNFEAGTAELHKGKLDRDLILVQLYNANGDQSTMKWWSTPDESNRTQTPEEAYERLALLPSYGERNAFRIAVIPKGTEVEYLFGTAAPQEENGVVRTGKGEQLRFRDFDEKWVEVKRPWT